MLGGIPDRVGQTTKVDPTARGPHGALCYRVRRLSTDATCNNNMQHATDMRDTIACTIQHGLYNMQHTLVQLGECNVHRTTRSIQDATCNKQRAACNTMQPDINDPRSKKKLEKLERKERRDNPPTHLLRTLPRTLPPTHTHTHTRARNVRSRNTRMPRRFETGRTNLC